MTLSILLVSIQKWLILLQDKAEAFSATAGAPQEMPLGCIGGLFRGLVRLWRVAEKRERGLGPKDAVSGRTLFNE